MEVKWWIEAILVKDLSFLYHEKTVNMSLTYVHRNSFDYFYSQQRFVVILL